MKNKTKTGVTTILLVIVILIICASVLIFIKINKNSKKSVAMPKEQKVIDLIQNIKAQPRQHSGKTVIVQGMYQGWNTGCADYPSPVTRSDWVVKDVTGCIFITGESGKLDPTSNLNNLIKVTGILKLTKDNYPYIEASKVEILDSNKSQSGS